LFSKLHFQSGVNQIKKSILFLLSFFIVAGQSPTVKESLYENLAYISNQIGGRPSGSSSDLLMRNFLLSKFSEKKISVYEQKITLITEKNNKTYINSSNIIAKITGKDTTVSIVLGAHHDTVDKKAEGANDNTSGVVLLLELAKYFEQNIPEVTIYFVFFAAEEHGLLGSKYFVSNFKSINTVKAMINFDMIGRGDISLSPSKRGVSRWAVDELIEALDSKNSEKINLNYLYYAGASSLGEDRTDHCVFEKAKIPSMSFSSRIIPAYYHSDEDRLKYLDISNIIILFDISKKLINSISEIEIFDESVNYLVVYLPFIDDYFTIDVSYVFVIFLNLFFLFLIQYTKKVIIPKYSEIKINLHSQIYLLLPLVVFVFVFVAYEELLQSYYLNPFYWLPAQNLVFLSSLAIALISLIITYLLNRKRIDNILNLRSVLFLFSSIIVIISSTLFSVLLSFLLMLSLINALQVFLAYKEGMKKVFFGFSIVLLVIALPYSSYTYLAVDSGLNISFLVSLICITLLMLPYFLTFIEFLNTVKASGKIISVLLVLAAGIFLVCSYQFYNIELDSDTNKSAVYSYLRLNESVKGVQETKLITNECYTDAVIEDNKIHYTHIEERDDYNYVNGLKYHLNVESDFKTELISEDTDSVKLKIMSKIKLPIDVNKLQISYYLVNKSDSSYISELIMNRIFNYSDQFVDSLYLKISKKYRIAAYISANTKENLLNLKLNIKNTVILSDCVINKSTIVF
jgi:hypothetical protein